MTRPLPDLLPGVGCRAIERKDEGRETTLSTGAAEAAAGLPEPRRGPPHEHAVVSSQRSSHDAVPSGQNDGSGHLPVRPRSEHNAVTK